MRRAWWLTLALILMLPVAAQAPDVSRLSKSLEQLRGLKFSRKVPSQVYSQKQAAAYVKSIFDSEAARTPYAVREGFLHQFGLLPPQTSLRLSLRELYGEQVRGLYDPYKKAFLVVTGTADLDPTTAAMSQAMGLNMDDLLTIHELDHALQDQHFNLLSIDRGTCADFDRALAAQSLIEGDAYLVMFDYAAATLGVDPSAFEQAMPAGGGGDFSTMLGNQPVMAKSPPFIRSLVSDPYFQGMQFCSALRQKGGWSRVDQAFRRLPASSEQILHPDKYLKNEGPVAVSVSLPESAGGFKRLGHDTAGEFTVRALGSPEAAAGWGGDRYTVYQKGTSQAVVWMTVWDSDGDAREFETLARQRVAAARVAGRVNEVVRKGRRVLVLRNTPPDLKVSL